VFLNEERARVRLGDEAEPVVVPWYLDTGASNHMIGNRSVFADLDTAITGSVRFGDNSIVNIKGRGAMLITIRGGEHRTLTDSGGARGGPAGAMAPPMTRYIMLK
jgi:hypothetical protein